MKKSAIRTSGTASLDRAQIPLRAPSDRVRGIDHRPGGEQSSPPESADWRVIKRRASDENGTRHPEKNAKIDQSTAEWQKRLAQQ